MIHPHIHAELIKSFQDEKRADLQRMLQAEAEEANRKPPVRARLLGTAGATLVGAGGLMLRWAGAADPLKDGGKSLRSATP